MSEGKVSAWAAKEPNTALVPFSFTPRTVGEHDVEVKITHCSICASDVHQVENGWGNSTFPMVPGHEIVGEVRKVGSQVKDFKAGDRVGVGTVVLSCFDCKHCKNGEEMLCNKSVFTYNAKYTDGSTAYGGYASQITCHEHFVFHIPKELSSEGAAPLLCAGITTFTPFRLHADKTKPGSKIGVVGLGGLGHMGVKWAKALGCHVTVVSHKSDKEKLARELGADNYLVSSDEKQMKDNKETLSFLLITANAKGMKYEPIMELLEPHGVAPMQMSLAPIVMRSRCLSGSLVGGAQITREMLEFAAKHRIEATVDSVMPMSEVNKAFKGMKEGKPQFRYVLTPDFEK